MSRLLRHRFPLLVACLCLTVAASARPAVAQAEVAGEVVGATDLVDADPAAGRLMADQLTLNALDLLQSPPDVAGAAVGEGGEGGEGGVVRTDQMVRAHVLMTLATQLVPGDAELWKLRAELEGRLEMPEARIASLMAYIRLRPEDDAAQLDVVLARLGQMPTLDKQLDLIEGLLTKSRSLSEPLRSRLAVYAAAASYENGKQGSYIRYAMQAAELDSTNADAAAMLYDIAVAGKRGPRVMGAFAVNLVRAAPFDAGPRLELGGLLAEQGLYEEAATQFGVAQRLLGGPLPMHAYRTWVMAMAAAGQDASANTLLDDLMAAARDRSAANGGSPTAPVDLQVLHLAVQDRPAQRDEAESSYRRIRDLLLERAATMEKVGDAGDAAVSWEEQLGWIAATSREMQNPKLEAAVLAAVFGFDLDRVGLWIAEADEGDPRVGLARGWLAYRQSFQAEAKRALEPLRDTEPLARLALAEMSGTDDAARARALREVVKSSPVSLGGLLAARRLLSMNRTAEPTDTGAAVRAYLQRWPPALWELDLVTAPWVTLEIQTPQRVFDYLAPIELTVTVRNQGPVPMAMTRGGPLGTLLLVQMEPSSAAGVLGELPPMVVDVGRRLVLQRGEAVSVTVKANRSPLGMLTRRRPFASVSIALTAMLNPTPGPDGRMTPGPLTNAESLKGLRASGEAVTEAAVGSWLGAMRSRDPVLRMRALARLIQLDPQAAADVFNQALAAKIEDAVVSAGTSDNPLMQAWVLLLSPYSGQVAKLDPVMEAAAASKVPLVRVAFLAAQRGELDEARLNAALREQNPLIQRYARAVKEAQGAR